MLKRFAFQIISLWCIVLTPLYAALEIEVTQGVDAAMPIAIIPFGGESRIADALTETITQDLTRSGEFKLLPAKSMAQKPTQPSQVDIDYWRRVKMDAVVIGYVESLPGQKYRVQYYLYDVYAKGSPVQPLLGQEFSVSTGSVRALAHHISDQIYQRLTGHPGAFSSRIAYVNVKWDRGKLSEYRLEVADSDGYNPRPLLTSPEPIMSPAWSPDGKQIAYVSFENFRSQIYVADVATGQRRIVSKQPGINGSPAWSPDGKKLAVVLSKQQVPKIYIINLANNQLEQITDGYSIDTEPTWSPDGRYLYYTSNRGGKPQIYRVNVSSKKIDRVTFDGDYNARPDITSDGNYLVMLHREGGRFHIAAQDLKSNQLYVLTQTELDQSPSLAPNDRMIIYSTLSNGQRTLSAVSIDGRIKLTIPTNDGEIQDPAWSPLL